MLGEPIRMAVEVSDAISRPTMYLSTASNATWSSVSDMLTKIEFGAPTPLRKVMVSLTADAEARMFVWSLGPAEKEQT